MLDLNMDSLALVSVFAQFEAIYQVEFTSDDLLSLFQAVDVAAIVKTLKDVLPMIETSVAKHGT